MIMLDDLHIIAPDPRVHREEMFDLIAKAFSAGGYYPFLSWLKGGYIDGGFYDWRASRVGILAGRIVTHWGVWGYTMRIGSARVRVAGVGAVATAGEFRGRGLMQRTASVALAAMADYGYDLSILFGIDGFYGQFGYVRAWSGCEYSVKYGDLPQGGSAPALRRCEPLAMPQLVRLFNRHHARATGTAVRPTYTTSDPRKGREGFMWTDGGGRPVGYVVVCDRGIRLDVVEAVGAPAQVLCAVRRLAQRYGADDVRFETLPWDSPLARTLRMGNCTVTIHHRRDGGAMVRCVDLPRTLDRMRGELTARLRASPLAGWHGRLLIDNGRQQAVLDIGSRGISVDAAEHAGAVPHAVRGGDAVAQLVLGTDDPLETARCARMRLAGDARMLLPVLFPAQHPMLHAADRF